MLRASLFPRLTTRRFVRERDAVRGFFLKDGLQDVFVQGNPLLTGLFGYAVHHIRRANPIGRSCRCLFRAY